MLKSFRKIVVKNINYLNLTINIKITIKLKQGDIMKLEELLAPCPKCGSKDKIAHRKMLDNHRAHAELDTVKCEECGYIYFVNDNIPDDDKKELLNELNKIYG